MNNERYEDTKRQLLLVSSLIQQLDTDDLINFVEYIDKSEEIGIGDRVRWEQIKGDTQLFRYVVMALLDIKSVLPEPRRNGHKTSGGSTHERNSKPGAGA